VAACANYDVIRRCSRDCPHNLGRTHVQRRYCQTSARPAASAAGGSRRHSGCARRRMSHAAFGGPCCGQRRWCAVVWTLRGQRRTLSQSEGDGGGIASLFLSVCGVFEDIRCSCCARWSQFGGCALIGRRDWALVLLHHGRRSLRQPDPSETEHSRTSAKRCDISIE
jgi:hypothetical protein